MVSLFLTSNKPALKKIKNKCFKGIKKASCESDESFFSQFQEQFKKQFPDQNLDDYYGMLGYEVKKPGKVEDQFFFEDFESKPDAQDDDEHELPPSGKEIFDGYVRVEIPKKATIDTAKQILREKLSGTDKILEAYYQNRQEALETVKEKLLNKGEDEEKVEAFIKSQNEALRKSYEMQKKELEKLRKQQQECLERMYAQNTSRVRFGEFKADESEDITMTAEGSGEKTPKHAGKMFYLYRKTPVRDASDSLLPTFSTKPGYKASVGLVLSFSEDGKTLEIKRPHRRFFGKDITKDQMKFILEKAKENGWTYISMKAGTPTDLQRGDPGSGWTTKDRRKFYKLAMKHGLEIRPAQGESDTQILEMAKKQKSSQEKILREQGELKKSTAKKSTSEKQQQPPQELIDKMSNLRT